MDKYINKLLDANNRVIIPDFGAFIVKQLHPRTIVFNEFLRYNDGLLVDLLAGEEKMDKETARQKITDYVDNLNDKLNKGEKYTITSLGTLVKEATGKITFIEPSGKQPEQVKEQKTVKSEKETKDIIPPVQEKKKPVEKPGTKKPEPEKSPEQVSPPEKTEKPEATEKKPEVKTEGKTGEIKKEEKKAEVKTPEKKDEVKAGNEEEQKKVPAQPVTGKTESAVKTDTVKSTASESSDGKPETSEKPAVPDEPAEPIEQPVEYQKRNNKRQILIWVILIIIVNGAIIYWFFFNDRVTGIFKTDNTELKYDKTENTAEPAATVVTNKTDSTAKESTAGTTENGTFNENKVSGPPAMPPPSAQAVRKTPVQASTGKKYYIVAGCFRDEANADRLVKELQDKGYDAEKFGKIGPLFAVSYGSFPDKSSADTELATIKKNVQADAWIVER